MKNSPLDDLKDILPKTKKEPIPNKKLGRFFLLCGLIILLVIPFTNYTSEEHLIDFSYLVLPFFVMGIVSHYLSLLKTLIIGLLSNILLFLFYQTLWLSL